jgi:cobalamin synthase
LLGALYFIAAFFRRKLGGATGDVLGFVSEIGELLFLVGAVLLAG